jgi:hypothetical protein
MLGRGAFRKALDAYRASRPAGDKEHRRETDVAAGSISPQKLYGTPVGQGWIADPAVTAQAVVAVGPLARLFGLAPLR